MPRDIMKYNLKWKHKFSLDYLKSYFRAILTFKKIVCGKYSALCYASQLRNLKNTASCQLDKTLRRLDKFSIERNSIFCIYRSFVTKKHQEILWIIQIIVALLFNFTLVIIAQSKKFISYYCIPSERNFLLLSYHVRFWKFQSYLEKFNLFKGISIIEFVISIREWNL